MFLSLVASILIAMAPLTGPAGVWNRIPTPGAKSLGNPPLYRLGHGVFVIRFKARIVNSRIQVIEIRPETNARAQTDWCVAKIIPKLRVPSLPPSENIELELRFCNLLRNCPDTHPAGYSLWIQGGK